MTGTPRIVYCLVFAVVALVFALAGTLGVLLWRYTAISNTLEGIETCKNEDLQRMFPGFFRTAEQQAAFVLKYSNVSRPVQTYNPKFCTFDCSAKSNVTFKSNNERPVAKRDVSDSKPAMMTSSLRDPLIRKKRAPPADATILFGPVYHACCQSWRIYTKPAYATSVDGDSLELVQGVFGLHQYFTSEHCEKDRTCTNCECLQPDPFVYTAVYYKDKNANSFQDKYGTASITLPGCCKCLNI